MQEREGSHAQLPPQFAKLMIGTAGIKIRYNGTSDIPGNNAPGHSRPPEQLEESLPFYFSML
jgi:hypothetical protein